MTSERILSGGTYIVKTNGDGRVIKEYGWASIKIINDNIIKILCEQTIGNDEVCIYTFEIKNDFLNLLEIILEVSNSKFLCLGFKNSKSGRFQMNIV